jgi:hypothetical protein
MQRIGREVLRESSFSYAAYSIIGMAAHLPATCFQTGLFASTVATFISISYQSLQQDPNAITQSLLTQISQQLPGSSNTTTSNTSPSINAQDPFSPPASAVFVNSVWFVSLVLSLTCAIMATMLQQWTRRYRQLTQRNYPPHVRAHIREYFARGADRFHISTLVETLPALLLISVLLFFSGLVVFAFRGNIITAYITVAIVTFCVLWYIILTLAPIIFHDCPYQTPLSTPFWFCGQVIQLSVFSVAFHAAKFFGNKLRVVKAGVVEAFHNRQMNKKESFSQGMISTLEGSAKRFSLDIFRTALCRTLYLIDEDHELEDFVAGIPGLSESEALRRFYPLSPHNAGRAVLAALPGPTTFHEQLPWSIVQLSQRAITNGLSESVQQRRTQVCLKALYYIPGAIRDVLAPYAAGTYNCLDLLPLLNSPESLRLIEELWGTDNDDVALSVRCVTAAITGFIVTPPVSVLEKFLPAGVRFIGRESPGSEFLSRRLRMNENWEDNDSARLQNIVHFLKDIKDSISSMDAVSWMRPDTSEVLLDEVRAERRDLHECRHSAEYCSGIFKAHGNRTSLAFVPAVQHDLLAVTLEIVTRDSVTDAAQVQRDAFHETFFELETSVETAHSEGRGVETTKMIVDTLRPIVEKLGLRAGATSTPQPGPEPPNQLSLPSSGLASSFTAHGITVESKPELYSGNDEVTPIARGISSSEVEGIPGNADDTFVPPTGSTTGALSTSPNDSSQPSHSLSSSSERAARDAATLV